MITARNILLPVLIMLLSASPSLAGSCGADRCWGAVAIGNNGQSWSANYKSQQGAINRVRNKCNGPCTTIKTFYNTCGAIAKAPSGAWGWAWHNSIEVAKSEAMAFCMDNGRNCSPRAWACSK